MGCSGSLNPIFMNIKAGLFKCCNTLKMEVELSSETSEQTYFTECDVPYDYHEAANIVAA